MSIYCINIGRAKRNTAGAKAPRDIASICEQLGAIEFAMPKFPTDRPKIYQKLWLATVCTASWRRLLSTVRRGDTVVYQHPMYGKRIALRYIPRLQKKGCRCVALIHDLESLRGGIAGVIAQNTKTNQIGDEVLLKCFDTVICHNQHMGDYLLGKGFTPKQLVNLEIFDYLTDAPMAERRKGERPSIAIAGNLAIGKCRYIYEITAEGRNPDLTVNLFGINFDRENATEQMPWHGSFTPEELPGKLVGDFGLVWDGTSAATCAGNTGEYLRYNNPHKTSLYLASGMPVIVWKQAAMADFVLEKGVGIAVDNLYELDTAIAAVSEEAYAAMCANACRIGGQLRAGAYFKAAVQ